MAGALAVGAIGTMILGFTWGGWMTESTANEKIAAAGNTATVNALVPFCVEHARKDPDFSTKLTSITSVSSWKQDDAFKAAGWNEVPNIAEMSNDMIERCIELLEAPEA